MRPVATVVRTPRRAIAEVDCVDRLLARITPQQREEVRRRMAQGDIPYLPEDVKIEVGRVFFPGIGWNNIPGVDPAKLPLDNIELLFVVRRGEEFGLEVTLKSAPDPTDEQKLLRRASKLRTGAARDKFLRKASPTVAAEVRSRLKRGQLAFLPEQLQVMDGQAYLDVQGKKLPVDNIDPASVIAGQIEVAFLLSGPAGNYLEIVWRTQ